MQNWFFVLLLAACAAAQAQTVTGVWKYEIPRGDGTSAVTYLDLNQDGNKVTGEVVENFRRVKLDNGTFENGKLHATMNPWRQIVDHVRRAVCKMGKWI